MRQDDPARRQDKETTGPVRRLLHLVQLCKESAEAIATNDHATMNEIEHSLAIAETATLRLLATMSAIDDVNGVVDLDEF